MRLGYILILLVLLPVSSFRVAKRVSGAKNKSFLVSTCKNPQEDVDFVSVLEIVSKHIQTEKLYKNSMQVKELDEMKEILKELHGGFVAEQIQVCCFVYVHFSSFSQIDANSAKNDDTEYSKNAHLSHLLYETDIMLDIDMARDLRDAYRRQYVLPMSEMKMGRNIAFHNATQELSRHHLFFRYHNQNDSKTQRNKRKIADFVNSSRQMWPNTKIFYSIRDGNEVYFLKIVSPFLTFRMSNGITSSSKPSPTGMTTPVLRLLNNQPTMTCSCL